jgi:hypothetical protein
MEYKELIELYSDYQLVCEQAIVNEEYKNLLNRKKLLEDEFKRRLRKDV